MSRRRAGRATAEEVLAQADEAPVEAAAAGDSATRALRRHAKSTVDEAADPVGIVGAEAAPGDGTAPRRLRFQLSAERDHSGGEDLAVDEKSDISPQAVVQALHSKAVTDRSQAPIIEIVIPAARVSTVDDPPLQLLHIKKNDFSAQVLILARSCSVCVMQLFRIRDSLVFRRGTLDSIMSRAMTCTGLI
jgi:hypothetical protein